MGRDKGVQPVSEVDVTPKAGDIVEALIACKSANGKRFTRPVRIRLNRAPWSNNERSTVLCGEGVGNSGGPVAVLTDSIRVVAA
jgi:hypothetical protein